MQFTNLAALFLSAITLSSAAAIHPRIISADTIVQDIQNIHSGVLANQAATEAYEGGDVATTLIEGTPEILTVGAIHLANRKGFVDANLAPQFNEADTRKIFNKVVDTVNVSIPDDIDILISKYPNFKESGLAPLVLSGLKLLINDHDTFSAAVESKAYKRNAALTAEGIAAVSNIHNAIQRGIDVYSA
ncbi:hypothetical protein Q7P36_004444 [Cladosporium allicinum]